MKTKNTKPRIVALIALTLLMLTQYIANAQSDVKRSVNGNFSEVKTQEAKHDSTTTYTYTDAKGKTEPVYQGSKGSYYVGRTSKKSGKFYRKYLKTED